MTDPEVDRITWMKSKRVGYTKVLTALNGYHMTQDPCSILHVQPTVEDAEGYSKDEIDPMIRDIDEVSEVFGDLKSRTKSNTILKKAYPGGTMYLVGANSGRGFRRISVRLAQFDEVDAYPFSAGREGDVIALGVGRTEDAWNSKVLIGSTPLIKGTSVVEKSYEESDKRRFYVPCPHCDHGQVLKWGGKDADYGLKWPKDQPQLAAYLCEQCHCMIEHWQKFAMLDKGEWIAEKPFQGHAGFHIWAAYSYLPKASWGHIAQEWSLIDKSPGRLQVFVNTVLGETWEEVGDAPSEEKLMERREAYPTRVVPSSAPNEEAKLETLVPRRVAVLTAMVDVQNNRLEAQVMGWGRGEELWALEYRVLYGDPTAEAVWQDLHEFLLRPRYLERGGVDFIRSTCIDSGYASQSVYGFVAHRPVYITPDGRISYTWATKGYPGTGPVWPKKPGKSAMANVPLYPVKVDTAKDQIASRVRSISKPGPGYIHFPLTFGEDYFRQFTSEQAFNRVNAKGFPQRVWEMKKGRVRNETWDTAVGNFAALCALYSVGFDLEAECAEVDRALAGWEGFTEEDAPAPMLIQPVITPQPAVSQRPSGWLNGGRRRGWLE